LNRPEEENGTAPPTWEVLSRTTHADCRVFSIERKRCRHPKRKMEADFFSVHSAPWVNVLALTPARELVLVNQFRFGVETHSLEIPGGIIDPGEDPVEAGLRELLEETGYAGSHARVLGSVWPNPAIIDNICSFVLVEEASLVDRTKWDEHEELEVSLLPAAEVMAAGRDGRIRHSLVLNALFFLEPLLRSSGQR
jgi:ADP-ribose pyrophosphatase